MTKKLMIGVAVGALMMSGALAQTTNSPSGPTSNPPPVAQNAPAGGKNDVVASQKPGQWLASKFKGTEVDGADNQKIGSVSDILFDKSGKIEAFVVSVGGFLGMGVKEVALAPNSFDVIPGVNGAADKLKLAMNKDELKQAQNFTPYEPPRPTTTGQGRPAGTPGALSVPKTTPPSTKQ